MGATTGMTTVTGIPGKKVVELIFHNFMIKNRTKLSPVVGHGLSVIAGGGGDDSLPLLSLVQHEQSVPRSPLLETPGILHVLFLQVDGHLRLLRHVRRLKRKDFE